ncbi:hypothetical protein [Clostridium botulinum]|uniref:hypothetical protein n=1 Tax=Clostridium botulinum TaxID=1491 RepID=UPI001969E0D0|nr:hypothetical protein [Clostridium botulinum]MBN3402863.1 hypothetical protein [Clostridium botulinum]MBN3447628.1 hypothetical protein [Clostridium botulinum]
MIGENTFKKDIGHIIKVQICSEECFKGKLIDIQCNTFIIENNMDLIEMFRLEDIQYLKTL